jgi:hypothetical protein
MPDVNRSTVQVNLRDVYGSTITDRVELKFYNRRAESLNQRFLVQFASAPATLPDVPAFPFGLAEVFINPHKYRYKSVFVNVPAGEPGSIDETFFVDPDRVRPVFPAFSEIQNQPQFTELARILARSRIADAGAWSALADQQKAGLLNLHAKMMDVRVSGDRPVAGFLDRILRFLPERIFAILDANLLHETRALTGKFRSVSGALHEFPEGWTQVADGPSSFKTPDRAGNLQLTFAQTPEFTAQGQLLADIDIDDHAGVEHAFDVLKHKITGRDTNPYDIHQILKLFQGLDAGYRLV